MRKCTLSQIFIFCSLSKAMEGLKRNQIFIHAQNEKVSSSENIFWTRIVKLDVRTNNTFKVPFKAPNFVSFSFAYTLQIYFALLNSLWTTSSHKVCPLNIPNASWIPECRILQWANENLLTLLYLIRVQWSRYIYHTSRTSENA